MKSRYIVLISIFFGLLTGYFIYDYLVKAEKAINTVQYEDVAVAVQDVPSKSRVTREMVELKKVPVEHIHPQAVHKTEEVIGAITVVPLIKGEQVLKNRIVLPNEVKNGLSYLIPAGKRALTVAVDEVSGISGLIRPGDRVDEIGRAHV